MGASSEIEKKMSKAIEVNKEKEKKKEKKKERERESEGDREIRNWYKERRVEIKKCTEKIKF